MFGRIFDSKWFYIISVTVVIAAFLATVIDIRQTGDSRPSGSIEDIKQLAERDDTNVLFILIDTLRRGNLGAYSYARDTSPVIDHIAATGITFNHQLSQSSWTKCSMASMWTGLYPIRTGVLKSQHRTSKDATMPAEIFKDAGFTTAGIWRNGWIAANFGFDQGFDIYHRPIAHRAKEVERLPTNPSNKLEGTDADVTGAALEFLRVNHRSRWFLYLHLMDIHQYVYDEDSALFGTGYTDVYDNSIRRTNSILNQLISTMDRAGYLENTVLVFLSDHGEAFGEHGREGHARDVYGEVTEVPFIIGLPFKLKEGIVIDTPSENVDVWPTILDLLGLPALPEADGQSRLPEILAAAAGTPLQLDEEEVRYAHLDQDWGTSSADPKPVVSVSKGRYRYIYASNQPNKGLLFDKLEDPKEQANLAAGIPDVAAQMKSLAESYLEFPPPSWGVNAELIDIDEMQLNQLRALGYQIP